MTKLVPPEDETNTPAFNIDTHSSQKVNDTDIPELPPADSGTETETKKETRQPSSSGKKDDAIDEPTPKFQKRFSEVYGEAKRLEREAEYERERADRMERLLERQLTQGTEGKPQGVPEKWKKILGETPVTEEFYQAMKEEFGNNTSMSREEMLEVIREEQRAIASGHKEVENSIELDRESLEDRLGRELTDDEASEVLEIAYELTPKDRDGNYEQLVPMSAAYGEYRARQLESKTPQRNARTQAAAVIGTRSGNIAETPRPTSGGRPDPGAWRSIFRT